MIIGFIAIVIIYVVLLAAGEMLYQGGAKPLVTRKIIHIGGGIISAFLPLVVNLRGALIIGLSFVIILFFSQKKGTLGSVHTACPSDNLGAVLFPLGIMSTAVLFWPVNHLIFQGSVLVLGLADGLAGLIGPKINGRSYSVSGRKTLGGSLVFFAVTLLILSGVFVFSRGAISLLSAGSLLVGAATITAVEGLFGKGWDNFFVPLASGAVIWLLL